MNINFWKLFVIQMSVPTLNGRDDVHRLVSFDYKTKTKYSQVKGVNIVEIL